MRLEDREIARRAIDALDGWHTVLWRQNDRANEAFGAAARADPDARPVARATAIAEIETFVIALAQFRTAVSLVERLTGRDLAFVTEMFDQRVPNWKAARNAIIHFDEYLEGMGRGQSDEYRPVYVIWQELDGRPVQGASYAWKDGYVLTLEAAEYARPIYLQARQAAAAFLADFDAPADTTRTPDTTKPPGEDAEGPSSGG